MRITHDFYERCTKLPPDKLAKADSARREIDMEMHRRRVCAAGQFRSPGRRQIGGRGFVHFKQLDRVAVPTAARREIVDTRLSAG